MRSPTSRNHQQSVIATCCPASQAADGSAHPFKLTLTRVETAAGEMQHRVSGGLAVSSGVRHLSAAPTIRGGLACCNAVSAVPQGAQSGKSWTTSAHRGPLTPHAGTLPAADRKIRSLLCRNCATAEVVGADEAEARESRQAAGPRSAGCEGPECSRGSGGGGSWMPGAAVGGRCSEAWAEGLVWAVCTFAEQLGEAMGVRDA